MRRFAAWVVLAHVLCAGCSSCGGRDGASDAGAEDPLVDRPWDLLPDEPLGDDLRDVGLEEGDGWDDPPPAVPWCGADGPVGMAVEPDREATSCGTGCVQVTLNDEVKRYFARDDHLVYSAMKDMSFGIPDYMCGWIYDVHLVSFERTRLIEPNMERCRERTERNWMIGLDDGAVYWWLGWFEMQEETRMVVYNICHLDLETMRTRPLWRYSNPVDHGGGDYWDVHGGRIVWMDALEGTSRSEIYWLDTSTGEFRTLSKTGCCVAEPGIWGEKVVWEDFLGSNYSIVVHDTSTGEERALHDDLVDRISPDIHGSNVVWDDCRQPDCGGIFVQYNTDIFMMDFETGEERRITDAPGPQGNPQIAGRYIAWEDGRDDEDYRGAIYPWPLDEIDIYLYDLEEGREYRVTDFPGVEKEPMIDGERVFWIMDDAHGVPSVFMKSVESIKAAAGSGA